MSLSVQWMDPKMYIVSMEIRRREIQLWLLEKGLQRRWDFPVEARTVKFEDKAPFRRKNLRRQKHDNRLCVLQETNVLG